MFGAITPMTLIVRMIEGTEVFSVAMTLALLHGAVVLATIGPGEGAFTLNLVVGELSVVSESVVPGVSALSMHESSLEGTGVVVAIEEVDVADAMEALIVNSVVDVSGDVAVPLAVILDGHV